jgi:hypothetical protein
LWLSSELITALGLQRGDKMTAAQYADSRVQSLIQRRLNRKPEDPRE